MSCKESNYADTVSLEVLDTQACTKAATKRSWQHGHSNQDSSPSSRARPLSDGTKSSVVTTTSATKLDHGNLPLVTEREMARTTDRRRDIFTTRSGATGARSFGHIEIDLTNTVFNDKVTEVGVVWLSIRKVESMLRPVGPQGCMAVRNACGLGSFGRRSRREQELFALLARSARSLVWQVFQAPKNKDLKGQTTWNRSAISLRAHTRRRIDLQHREGRFHVCDCISQLYRIEIRVCVINSLGSFGWTITARLWSDVPHTETREGPDGHRQRHRSAERHPLGPPGFEDLSPCSGVQTMIGGLSHGGPLSPVSVMTLVYDMGTTRVIKTHMRDRCDSSQAHRF